MSEPSPEFRYWILSLASNTNTKKYRTLWFNVSDDSGNGWVFFKEYCRGLGRDPVLRGGHVTLLQWINRSLVCHFDRIERVDPRPQGPSELCGRNCDGSCWNPMFDWETLHRMRIGETGYPYP